MYHTLEERRRQESLESSSVVLEQLGWVNKEAFKERLAKYLNQSPH